MGELVRGACPDPGSLDERHALIRARGALLGRSESKLCVSRYTLLERIAGGGSGVVYVAYDPELDRNVALKLIPLREDHSDDQWSPRVLREARAMAKIAHPNVITVHDAGTWDELGGVESIPTHAVFIVMELVTGESMPAWLNNQARTWREILAKFDAAGAGLCAAHAIGIVHRDFKPANVLIGSDGRVRVVDFGLARDFATPAASGHTAVVQGTPEYMAPEQHRGELADASGDQFAFCAAVHEALYDEPPFVGGTLEELRREKELGRIRAPTKRMSVPVEVRKILARGLHPNPRRRFSSMEVLLSGLRRASQARRGARWTALATGVAIVAGTIFGLDFVTLDRAERAIRDVRSWNEHRELYALASASASSCWANQCIMADSARDFSTEQGYAGWWYGYYEPLEDLDGHYDPLDDFQPLLTVGEGWKPPESKLGYKVWTGIWEHSIHPHHSGVEHWTIRRWKSPLEGPASVAIVLAKEDPRGGDGVEGKLLVDGVEV